MRQQVIYIKLTYVSLYRSTNEYRIQMSLPLNKWKWHFYFIFLHICSNSGNLFITQFDRKALFQQACSIIVAYLTSCQNLIDRKESAWPHTLLSKSKMLKKAFWSFSLKDNLLRDGLVQVFNLIVRTHYI